MTAKEWCIANRQWRRQDNIKHAAYQYKVTTAIEEQKFWLAVYELLK